MKYLLMVLLIAGCGSSSSDTPVESKGPVTEPIEVVDNSEPIEIIKDTYIVAGQSNARYCDWSYFEHLTGSKVVNLSISGKGIDYLISAFPSWSEHTINPNIKAILFVHGETDSIIENENYVSQVEKYRLMIGDYPLLISNVGNYDYHLKGKYPDSMFQATRDAVNKEAAINNNWNISFNEAKSFYEYGMLKSDGVHFTEEGCMMMMDAFAESIHKGA